MYVHVPVTLQSHNHLELIAAFHVFLCLHGDDSRPIFKMIHLEMLFSRKRFHVHLRDNVQNVNGSLKPTW